MPELDRIRMIRKLVRVATTMLLSAAFVMTGIGRAGAADIIAKTVLAPSGKLRVGLYPGTPTSILQPNAQSPDPRGVGYDLGKEFAARLGIPYEPVVFTKNAEVLDALKTGQVDMAFTNATAVRAKDMDFGPPYLEIELGYLVPQGSRITTSAEVDTTERRIGVTTGSSSDGVLSRELKLAIIVRAATVDLAVEMLRAGQLDAFATNKATLFEMAEKLSGSQVLEGRWGVERHAIAIPKGRDQGIDVIKTFTQDAISAGLVERAIARAGLRGAIRPDIK